MPKFLWMFFLILLFVASLATSYESGLRYLKYLLIAAPIIKLASLQNVVLNKILVKNLFLYLVLIACNVLVAIVGNNLSIRMLMEILLLLIPLAAALGFSEMEEAYNLKILRYLFYVYVLSYLVVFWQEIFEFLTLLDDLPLAILYSNFQTESWLGFVFAIFSLFFFITKQRWHFVIALVLAILAFKRVALLASVASIGTYFFLFQVLKLQFKPIRYKVIFSSALMVGILLFFLFISGYFTTFIQTQTGLSINHFTQGRYFVYNRALLYFTENHNLFFGSYLGASYDFLSQRYAGFDFLHSDILKLILEFGIPLSLVWFASIIHINLTNRYTFVLLLFIFVLFFTDNTLIYFDLMFLFYLMLNYFSQANANIDQ